MSIFKLTDGNGSTGGRAELRATQPLFKGMSKNLTLTPLVWGMTGKVLR